MICVHAIFHHHFFELDSFDFCLNSIKFLKCMIWQSFFFVLLIFSFFLVLVVCLLRTTMYAIDGPPDWGITFLVIIVLKGVVFWLKGCSCHFYPKKGLWLKSIFEKWAILVNVPQGTNRSDFGVSRLWDLWFWSLKGFWLDWNCSKFWRIPNIKSYKNSFSFVAWFSKNSRKSFWIKNFIIHCLNRRDQRVHLVFFKIVPLGAPRFFLFKWFLSERKCLSRWTDY